MNYLQTRLDELNITEEQNIILLHTYHGGDSVDFYETELKPHKIFTSDKKDNILILGYDLDRRPLLCPNKKDPAQNDIYYIKRVNDANRQSDDSRKYIYPAGAGTHPFFHPDLIGKFEKRQKISTLYITEGQFKTFKAAMHGLDIVGIAGIQNYKSNGRLHNDIVRILNTCKPNRICMIYDGDCFDISQNDIRRKSDLTRRPNQFYTSIKNIRDTRWLN